MSNQKQNQKQDAIINSEDWTKANSEDDIIEDYYSAEGMSNNMEDH